MEAQEWCHRYKVSGNVRDLNQAWDLYYHVFRRISRQLPQLTSLELQYVSPKLLMCRDLELAVPGSYIPGQPVVRIAQIQSSLQVITSKQRPRKLCIKGKVNQLIHSVWRNVAVGQEIQYLYGTWMFIIVLTKSHHWARFHTSYLQSTPSLVIILSLLLCKAMLLTFFKSCVLKWYALIFFLGF